jgi:hypothetical protein
MCAVLTVPHGHAATAVLAGSHPRAVTSPTRAVGARRGERVGPREQPARLATAKLLPHHAPLAHWVRQRPHDEGLPPAVTCRA